MTTRTISIAALTYQRPVGLRRLLDHLTVLDADPGVALSIVIVDNDPACSGREIVEAASSTSPHPVQYISEPRRGISTARNAAVDASRGADFMAFIDDDEWPEPDWITQLLATHDATGAAVVAGCVVPVFDDEPPSWVLDGGFFDRRRHRHNERMHYATTSNVLISMEVMEDRPEPFDPAFGLSGGEDTHLFAQLRTEGHAIHWCDRADVFESIPTSRVDAGWLLDRERRRGQTLSLSLRARGAGPFLLAKRAGNGLRHITTGGVLWMAGRRRDPAARLTARKRIVFGLGMLQGLAGLRYAEYETTHGS